MSDAKILARATVWNNGDITIQVHDDCDVCDVRTREFLAKLPVLTQNMPLIIETSVKSFEGTVGEYEKLCLGGAVSENPEGEMFLPRAEEDLLALTKYLETKGYPRSLIRIQVEWSEDADLRNRKDPRGFCHVDPNEWKIYCSRAIEDVSPAVRMGLLLHEIGHLVLDAFDGDESEVDVDAWAMSAIPEAGYHYMPVYEYFNSQIGETVKAKNIEALCASFVKLLRA